MSLALLMHSAYLMASSLADRYIIGRVRKCLLFENPAPPVLILYFTTLFDYKKAKFYSSSTARVSIKLIP